MSSTRGKVVEEGSDSYLTLSASWRSRHGQELVEGDLSVCRLDQEPMLGLHAASWSLGAGAGQGREFAGWVQHEASTGTGVGVLLNRVEGGCVTRSRDRGRWKEEFQTPPLCLSQRVIAHALGPSSLSPDRQPFGR